MKLIDLLGKHTLDAVDFYEQEIEGFLGCIENCSVCRFRLDGVVYVAVEDPEDGYRSCMRNLSTADPDSMKNVFQSIEVVGTMKADGPFSVGNDVLQLIDAVTGKVVLSVGTENADDYYPCFVADFQPSAMAINN